MYFHVYRAFSVLASPLIDLYFIRRKKIGKEDPLRFRERLGHAGFPKTAGPLVWIHAASVGESMSVLPLINRILENYQDVNIMMTTGTRTSAEILQKRLPERAFHQYVPIDKLIPVKRFIKHWQPDLALWVESELWPNLITETHNTGCPMIQINARMSVNSFEKWQQYKSLIERMLHCFSLSLAQSEEDKQRLHDLGAPDAKYLGNLKFDAPALPSDPKETGRLLSQIGDRPMWLAASTHPGEEEIICRIHKKLKEHHENILTIIVPRHPERGEEIVQIVQSADLTPALRANADDISQETDIYIANTIGQMGIFYRLASIVFMGGSLVEHGGQNPLEAARLECALITGPHTENFTTIYHELEQEKAVLRIKDEDALEHTIDTLLNDSDIAESLSTTALQLINAKAGVISRYMDAIAPYLKSISKQVKNHENA